MTSDVIRGACYLFAAAMCVFAGVIEYRERQTRFSAPVVWVGIGALLFAIAATEWWNLGHLLADAGRSEARAEGWYADRRAVQAMVVVGIVVIVAIAWLAISVRVPRKSRRYLPAATTAAALAAFVVVRGISLHQLDATFNRGVAGPVRAGDLAEVFAAALIGALAIIQVVARPSPRPRAPRHAAGAANAEAPSEGGGS